MSDLATEYIDWYKDVCNNRAAWVKDGILESYKVVTDTYKTQVAGVVGSTFSLMVAQLAANATIIPLFWNLSILLGVLCLATIIHFRMLHKVSIINARMGAITGATGSIFIKMKRERQKSQ